MKKQTKKGFTLVELLVVIAILAILASVSVVGYLGFTKKANESNCLTEATQVRDVVNGVLLTDAEVQVTVEKDGAAVEYLVSLDASKKITVKTGENDADAADIDLVFTSDEFADLDGLDGTITLVEGVLVYTTDTHKATINLESGVVDVTEADAQN